MALVGEAHIIIKADTSSFKKEIEAALAGMRKDVSRVGKDIGRDLSNSINSGSGKKGPFSNLLREADQAKQAFNSLIKRGYVMGPIISGAASAVSDLVQALFAVGSAVGSAAPALAVFPGILAAIAQGALTAKVAFGGVMNGISAINKQKTGKTTDTTADAGKQRAIEDARRRLARVYQDSADQMAAANDKVRQAQIALNQAYKDGAESLQQLGFNAEEAALAQDKAAIQLERARESLLRTQDVPVDSRARREAEIAFKEAELNYRQAKDKSNDLAKAQEYAARTGIEGTKEVLSAKKDLNVAETDRAKTERDNARQIADAQLALQRALEEAAKKANKSTSDTKDLLKDLSKEARKFVLHMVELRPQFLALRHAAGKELFGPLTVAINNIVSKLFPVLKPILTAMGGVIGKLALQFARMLTSVQNLDIFKRVFGGTNLKVMQNVGDALVAMAEAALNVLDATRPLVLTFSSWIQHLTNSIRLSAILSNGSGALSDKLSGAGNAAKKLGDLIKNTYQAFSPFGKAAKDAGFMIIDALNGALIKMKEFGKAGLYSGELETHFKNVATNVIAIGHFIGEVIKLLYNLGGNPGVKAFMDQISVIPAMLTPIMKNMTGLGDIFGKFIVSLVTLLLKFAETGGITNFFNVLNKALAVVTKIFDNKALMRVFTFMAALHGVTLALGLIGSTAATAFKILFGKLMFLPKLLMADRVSILALNGSVTSLTAKLALAEERAIAMQFALAYNGPTSKIGGFKNLTFNLKKLGEQALNTGKAFTLTGLQSIKGAMTFSNLGKVLMSPIKAMRLLNTAFIELSVAILTNPIGLAIVAIVALGAIIVMAYKKSKAFQKSVSDLGKAITGALHDGISLITNALKSFLPVGTSFGEVFKKIGDFIAKYLMPVLTVFIVGPIKLLAAGIAMIIGQFQIFFNVVTGVIRLTAALGYVIISIFTGKTDAAVKTFRDTMYSVLNGIIKGINTLINAFNSISKYLGFTIPTIKLLGDTQDVVTTKTDKATTAAKKHAAMLLQEKHNAAELDKKFKDTGAMYKFLTDKANDAFGAATNHARALIAARDAAKSLRETDKTLAESIKDTTKPITDRKDSLYDFAASYLDAAEASVKAGKSSKFVGDMIDDGRNKFVKGAKAIGLSTTAAEKLADSLGLTPETIKKTFEVTGIDKLRDLTDRLTELNTAYNAGIEGKYNANMANAIARYKKAHPQKAGQSSYEYINAARTAASKELQTKITEAKSKIAVQMELSFGVGQNKDKPMFVKVTNPADIGKPKGQRATGGQVSGGSTYLVGERGPELFQAPTSGNIIPNHQVGVGNTVNVTVNPSPGMDEREIASLVSRRLAFMQRGA